MIKSDDLLLCRNHIMVDTVYHVNHVYDYMYKFLFMTEMFHENMHIIATTYDKIISECRSNFELSGLYMGWGWLGWVWGRWAGKAWKNGRGGGGVG